MSTRPLLELMPDGTFKHRHPVTGTEVWNIHGRSLRPVSTTTPPDKLASSTRTEMQAKCDFCPARRLETPPEKQRWSRSADGSWKTESHVPITRAATEPADFRRVANLYEIVPLSYWKANRGFTPSPDRCAWKNAVLSDPAGRKHVLALVRSKWKRSGKTEAELDALGENALLESADPFFFGSHDLLVSGAHYPAEDAAGILPASSGDLSWGFHRRYMAAAAATAKDIYDHNPMARYVAVFQNYLPGAGASFEHLHKQILGVDEIGPYPEALERAAAADPALFNRSFLAPSVSRGWTIARNSHAVAVAAFGIPHPAFWVFSTSRRRRPWELFGEELDGFSDVLHACHAASGFGMPSNEEWAYSAPGRKPLIPFHVTVRWRPNIHAGFEGDTGIFINPLRPDEMRNRLVEALQDSRKTSGRLGDVEVGGDPGPDPIPQPD